MTPQEAEDIGEGVGEAVKCSLSWLLNKWREWKKKRAERKIKLV